MKLSLALSLLATILCFASLVHADDPLPRVLLIGDSISIGYTRPVTKLLDGKAVVVHHKGNAQHTGTGLQLLDSWLGEKPWDVIHFNWGLWDLCYRSPESENQGSRDKENGTLTTSLEIYEKNLDQLVSRLKQTEAKLIWASISFVPPGEAGRKVGDDLCYNEVAARVMNKHGIAINDLNALTKEFDESLFTAPGNVHYTAEGSQKIAEQVAQAIQQALQPEASSAP